MHGHDPRLGAQLPHAQTPTPPRRLSNLAMLAGVGGVVCLFGALFLLVLIVAALTMMGAGTALAASDQATELGSILWIILALGGLVVVRVIIQGIATHAWLPGLLIASTLALAVVAHVRIARDARTRGVGCVGVAYVFALLAAFGIGGVLYADASLPKVDPAPHEAPAAEPSAAAISPQPPGSAPAPAGSASPPR